MSGAYRSRLWTLCVVALAALMLTACGVPVQDAPEPLQSDVVPAAFASVAPAPD